VTIKTPQDTTPSLEEINLQLSTLSCGKPTEGAQLRLNQHDMYLLNLADDIARRHGYRSRHAWMVEAVMNRATELLSEEYSPAPKASFAEE
jgi:hypothetical protein